MLADVDPLGVNQNVTFDEVGGLDDRASHFVLDVSSESHCVYRHQRSQGNDAIAFVVP